MISDSFVTPWTLYNPPGSSIHEISQATILGWVDISFSRAIFPTQSGLRLKSESPALAGGFFTTEPPGKSIVFFIFSPPKFQYNRHATLLVSGVQHNDSLFILQNDDIDDDQNDWYWYWWYCTIRLSLSQCPLPNIVTFFFLVMTSNKISGWYVCMLKFEWCWLIALDYEVKIVSWFPCQLYWQQTSVPLHLVLKESWCGMNHCKQILPTKGWEKQPSSWQVKSVIFPPSASMW